MECSLCGGELTLMGKLGDRSHYRCRSCGMNCSAISEPEDEDEDDPSCDFDPDE